ncbi:MAG: hypothetical protein MJZ87_00460 [Bacteroidales bacterium]|nr:hypothetical protein [Bacteroidales bacterium]
MAVYYNNILCVSSREMCAGIVTYANLNKLITRKKVDVVKRGGGEDNPSLIRFDNLPERLKGAYVEKYGNPKDTEKYASFTAFIEDDFEAERYFAEYTFEDGSHLTDDVQRKYCANARVLNAVVKCQNWKRPFIKALGGSHGVNGYICEAVNAIRNDVRYAHTLPENERRLASKAAEYRRSGYASLVSGRHGNRNAGKVLTKEQESTLRTLMGNYRNLDNEQILAGYNDLAKTFGWKSISASTVGRLREKWNLYLYGQNAGETAFNNDKQMLVKRTAPSASMMYWVSDGWDVELLYQKTSIDKQGHSVTTYHNRLTVVVVLDPVVKYPIGYAIGDHETAGLIREAYRNALLHTRELFGKMYRPAQIQTDNYGRGALKGFYQAASAKYYTPAKVKNAKSKVVEPYFEQINHDYCQLMMRNWAGYGIKSEKQPNPDYLDKIKHDFPDEEGCRKQIDYIMQCERNAKVGEYRKMWDALPESERYELSEADYLYYLGESTARTIRLQPMGICPTIGGVQYYYDCFDLAFRKYNYLDWSVKYDPSDMGRILVSGDNGKVRFVCERKYEQPMALLDRRDGDAEELTRVRHYNKALKEMVLDRNEEDYRVTRSIMEEVGRDEMQLTKMLLTDSCGQHKDRRNQARLTGEARKALEAAQAAEAVEVEAEERSMAENYLNSRVNFDEFIN